MTDDEREGMEDESGASKRARRTARLRRSAEEAVMALTFLLAVFYADDFSDRGRSAFAAGFVAAAVVALAGLFLTYIRRYLALDEFERQVETKALAIAGGGAVMFAASWGVAEIILSAPDFPLYMIAPMFSIIYMAARHGVSSAFR